MSLSTQAAEAAIAAEFREHAQSLQAKATSLGTDLAARKIKLEALITLIGDKGYFSPDPASATGDISALVTWVEAAQAALAGLPAFPVEV